MTVLSSGGLQTRSDRGSQPLVARLSVTCRLLDAAENNRGDQCFPDKLVGRVLHVTWITILHIDVNCVLTRFIYLVVMSYVTGMLLVTTLTAIRWHFWVGRKDSLWQTRNATIRNSNQFETAIGAFVCFNLHQWSLVYLMFCLACIQTFWCLNKGRRCYTHLHTWKQGMLNM